MSKYEQKHKTAFIVFFFIIALVLNDVQFRNIENARLVRQQQQQTQQEQQRAEQQSAAALTAAEEQAQATELKRKQAVQEAAQEHSNYLARYLNSGFSRKPGTEAVAVAVTSENGAFNLDIARTLANHLTAKSVETLPSFFKPEFVSDGLINDGFDASSELLAKLELTNSLNGLLLAFQSVEYSPNASLDNVLTATMGLKVVAISLIGSAKSQTWTFTTTGSGFKEADARAMAEERLIKQISTDTNISLDIISPNNQ